MLSNEEEEKAVYKELQKRVCIEYGAEAEKFRLLRFLRARNYDIKQSENMFRNHVAWRKAEKMDTFLQTYEYPEILENYFPFYISELTADSVPVLIYQFGASDLKGIAKCLKKEEVLKGIAFLLETCEQHLNALSERTGKRIEKWNCIVNFDKSTLFQVTNKLCVDILLAACSCYETNYPERLEKIYVVNGTVYFNIIFNILKNVLSPVTVNKVKLFGRDGWQEDVQKIVSPEMLSLLQGESNHEVIPSCVTTSFNYGGTVPKRLYFRSPERRLSLQSGVTKCTLKRNQKVDFPVVVTKAKSFLEWKFETENHDIGFGLSYKKTDDITEKKKFLVPMQKFEADMGYEVGSYMCQESGTYILTFDNTYSWFRQKQLYFTASVVEPGKEKCITGEPSLSH